MPLGKCFTRRNGMKPGQLPIWFCISRFGAGILLLSFSYALEGTITEKSRAAPSEPVTISESDETFTLANGLLSARVQKRTGTLLSLKYEGLELLAQNHSGANGGYWSS